MDSGEKDILTFINSTENEGVKQSRENATPYYMRTTHKHNQKQTKHNNKHRGQQSVLDSTLTYRLFLGSNLAVS